MHTVNKAYSLLRQEGYVKVDRRKGAVIAIDETREEHLSQIREVLAPIVLEAVCRNISREELHKMLDEIYDKYRL